ncbi:MAG: LPXTG cell wall anchor domain-containing protein [Clostridia bacterium]
MKKIFSILTTFVLMLTISASVVSASTVVPSIDQKQAPSLAVQTDADGNEYVATLVDADGNVYEFVGSEYIVLTPLSEADEIPTAEAQEMIENLYQRISSVEDLSEITSDLVSAVESFNDLFPDRDPELLIENLVVLDLFDLSVSDNIMELINGGMSIVVYFDLGVEENDPLFILHNYEGDECEILDTEYVGDGVVAATFTSLSPVAVIVEQTSEDEEEDVPQTGDDQTVLIFIITGIAAVAAAALLVLKRVTKK